jgi:hypothetical protein
MSFSHGSGLLFLKDSHSKLSSLVDSGATLSILPCSSSTAPSGPKLIGANGANIPTWGFQKRTLAFGHKSFTHEFLLAKVATPILGLDFLRKFQLSIHPLQAQVLDKDQRPLTSQYVAAATTPPPTVKPISPPRSAAAANPAPAAPPREVRKDSCSNSAADSLAANTPLQEVSNAIPEPVRRLLAIYPSIIRSETLTPSPTHGVEHHTDTGSHSPVFARPRRLAPDKLKIAEFKKLEKAGIIRRSNSTWASPLHMVPKKDGSWRPCGEYRRLNTVTTPDRYPLPNMQDLANGLHGCTVFSKIDLVKGYHQLPIATADLPKTAIITPFGLFEYLFMGFGLRNAAQTSKGQ